jgi:hypothetical protein
MLLGFGGWELISMMFLHLAAVSDEREETRQEILTFCP